MDNKLTNLTIYERNFIFGFKLFKDKILSDSSLMYKQEDVYGESSKVYDIWLYHLINMFGMLMKLRLVEWKDYTRLSSSFNFEDIRKALACKGIKLQSIIDVYNLIDETQEGISKLEIDKTLVVGDEHYQDCGNIDFDYYLNLTKKCEIFLDANDRGLATDITTGLETNTQTLLRV